MAVEPLSIAASIGSTLKFLTSAYLYTKDISAASDQAQQVADQLLATKALLKSLKHSLKAVQRPRQFVQQWAPTAESIMVVVQSTIRQLDQKLGEARRSDSGGVGVKLGFWAKVTWPLEREETLALQNQLYGSMQMLSMLQNALMMGTADAVQQSAQHAEETMTSIDFSCFSVATTSVVNGSSGVGPEDQCVNDNDTILADDSVSVRQTNHRPSIPWPVTRKKVKAVPSLQKDPCFFDTTHIKLLFAKVESGPALYIPVMTVHPRYTTRNNEVTLVLVANSSLVYVKLKSKDREWITTTYQYDLERNDWPALSHTSTMSRESLKVTPESDKARSGDNFVLNMYSPIISGKPVVTPLADAMSKLWTIWKPWHDAGCQSPILRPPGK